MPYLNAEDGTQLYFREWGDGPAIVLIAGWPLNSDMWEKQSTFLAEAGMRVVTYDRRGFGRSGQPWRGYDYDTLASDLGAIVEKLDLDDATLVGFSMGGGEVVRYLSRFDATRITKAVLVSAVTPFLLKTEDNPEGVDEAVFNEIEAHLRKDRPAFLKDFCPKFFGRTLLNHTVSEAVLEWSQSMALTGSLRATVETARSWSRTDFRSEMKRISIPVRIIHGTGDVNIPIDASARRSAELIGGSCLSEYDDEPHGLFLTAADRLNQEILEFVRGSDNFNLNSEIIDSTAVGGLAAEGLPA